MNLFFAAAELLCVTITDEVRPSKCVSCARSAHSTRCREHTKTHKLKDGWAVRSQRPRPCFEDHLGFVPRRILHVHASTPNPSACSTRGLKEDNMCLRKTTTEVEGGAEACDSTAQYCYRPWRHERGLRLRFFVTSGDGGGKARGA